MLQESGQLFPPEKLQNSDSIEIVILVETNITLLVTSGNRTDKHYQKHYKNMKDLYHLLGWSKHHNLCYQRQPNRQIPPETITKTWNIKIMLLVETNTTIHVTSGNRTAKELVQCMRGGDCEKVNTNFSFSVLCANMLQDDAKDGVGDIDVQWTLSMLMAVGDHWQTKYNFEYFSNKKRWRCRLTPQEKLWVTATENRFAKGLQLEDCDFISDSDILCWRMGFVERLND